MLKRILHELKRHAPFTLFGAFTGIVLMVLVVLSGAGTELLHGLFEGLHSVHVLLSALVTAAMYRRYRKNVIACILIGFVGSVGIATLSDVIFPHHGGTLILLATSQEAEIHFHIPFIEHWWLIGPMALVGVAIGMYKPMTKIPHTGHVLLSTWASLFYVIAHAPGTVNWLPLLPLVFVVLFVAVWLPCCVSDIAFPLLFVGKAGVEQGHHAHD